MKDNTAYKLVLGFSFALLGGFASLAKAEPAAPPANPMESSHASEFAKSIPARLKAQQEALKARIEAAHRKSPQAAYNELNLTTEQRQQIGRLKREMRGPLRNIMQNLNRLGLEMRILSTTKDFDEAKAKMIAKKQGQYASDLFFLQANMEHKMFMLLDDTQQVKLKEMYRAKGKMLPVPTSQKPQQPVKN